MQRQLRLGDILDDYCPRERRVTNHAIVAMMGPDVKQTRCTTCEAEHEYKQAKVPRQRRKTETPAALYATVLAGGPKRREPEPAKESTGAGAVEGTNGNESTADESRGLKEAPPVDEAVTAAGEEADAEDAGDRHVEEEGPVHRPLIRASLPRPEGTPPPQRPAPDFTIRQPGGRPPNRFRPRHQRGGQSFQGPGSRGNGNTAGGSSRGGMRHGGGRPPGPASSRLARRNGPGRKRSK